MKENMRTSSIHLFQKWDDLFTIRSCYSKRNCNRVWHIETKFSLQQEPKVCINTSRFLISDVQYIFSASSQMTTGTGNSSAVIVPSPTCIAALQSCNCICYKMRRQELKAKVSSCSCWQKLEKILFVVYSPLPISSPNGSFYTDFCLKFDSARDLIW